MKTNIVHSSLVVLMVIAMVFGTGLVQAADKIVHDAEYYILNAQNGERWAAEDKELDKTLAELRKKYGQPPNIVYILWDDTAFGAAGFPGLQKNFGYETPKLNKMAAEGINFSRMCRTPMESHTRVCPTLVRRPRQSLIGSSLT